MLESFFRRRLVTQRRASPETIVSYRDALRLFLVFVSEKISKPPNRLAVEDLDRDMVLAFLDHLEKERGNTIRTRNARLAAIRSFFNHVAYCDPSSVGISQRILSIESKRTVKRVIGYLRHHEMDAIISTPDCSTPRGRRDRALLLFLVQTGARVSEAVGVNLSDLRRERPQQVLLRGKGSKERIVPISSDMASMLWALCEERGVDPGQEVPVFVNARGQRLTRHGVIHILRRAVAAASKSCPEIAKRSISPHTLRHTAAMNLLSSGVDLIVIQSWLGHASMASTHQYVEVNLEMKRRALGKCEIMEAGFEPYKPTDEVLLLLESL
jgi:site-specific recombinase XerD